MRNYFAYGSNMSVTQMAVRCPDAKMIGLARLEGYQFMINRRGVATLIPVPGTGTTGLLWSISESDKLELDRYEGVSSGLYYEETCRVNTNDGENEALIYLASDTEPGVPRAGYLELIIDSASGLGIEDDDIRSLKQWQASRGAV